MEQLMTAEQVTTTDGATLALTRQGSGDPVLLVPGGTGQVGRGLRWRRTGVALHGGDDGSACAR
jgi:hypothetical protein